MPNANVASLESGEPPREEIACPACGKLNERSAAPDPNACRRCGCELAPLWRIRDAANARVMSGRAALRQRDYDRAMEDAGVSWELKPSEAAARLAFLSSLGRRDFSSATRWYRRALGFSRP